MMLAIANEGLPLSLRHKSWSLIYSSLRNGDSFDTFLRLLRETNADKTLLVIKTTRGSVFGGYADTSWVSNLQKQNTYFGSGQAMLFQLIRKHQSNPNNMSVSSVEEQQKYILKIFKWTGANNYVQLIDTSKKKLAFGGGSESGSFGLCVEDDFSRGSTGKCSTFDNEVLTSSNYTDSNGQPIGPGDEENEEKDGHFKILEVEVWGFLTYQF